LLKGLRPLIQHDSKLRVTRVQTLINASNLVKSVETHVRFTQADIALPKMLSTFLFVQMRGDVELSEEEIREELTLQVQERLLKEGFNVTPLVSLTVLEHLPRVTEVMQSGASIRVKSIA
jgi:uncharacterized membrane protein